MTDSYSDTGCPGFADYIGVSMAMQRATHAADCPARLRHTHRLAVPDPHAHWHGHTHTRAHHILPTHRATAHQHVRAHVHVTDEAVTWHRRHTLT